MAQSVIFELLHKNSTYDNNVIMVTFLDWLIVLDGISKGGIHDREP